MAGLQQLPVWPSVSEERLNGLFRLRSLIMLLVKIYLLTCSDAMLIVRPLYCQVYLLIKITPTPFQWVASSLVLLTKKKDTPINLINIIAKTGMPNTFCIRRRTKLMISVCQQYSNPVQMWQLYYKCFILCHLLKNYTVKRTQLLITVIDLSAAFNLISRDILWKKPVAQKMECKLFLSNQDLIFKCLVKRKYRYTRIHY